ncbi:redox-sensitive transcriptional activator SoxR [Rhizobium cremeum]|uniref:redox-sensitive transcriptional activator SoxR n=1 Tax=Rhizobium cremeum TaxID=2813827 RepID=UPI0039E11016
MQGLTVGEIARRSGVAVSAIHFYERKGLIASHRTEGNQRRFDRAVLRRIALIKVAQQLGVPLSEVAEQLAVLPRDRAPNHGDWQKIATRWSEQLNHRIRMLEALRDSLDGCIGCGCLSMTKCTVINPGDRLAEEGQGAVALAEMAAEEED